MLGSVRQKCDFPGNILWIGSLTRIPDLQLHGILFNSKKRISDALWSTETATAGSVALASSRNSRYREGVSASQVVSEGRTGSRPRVCVLPQPRPSLPGGSWTRRHKAQEGRRASRRSPDSRACPSCGGEAHKVRLSFRYQSLRDKSLHERKYSSWNHLPNSKDTFQQTVNPSGGLTDIRAGQATALCG